MSDATAPSGARRRRVDDVRADARASIDTVGRVRERASSKRADGVVIARCAPHRDECNTNNAVRAFSRRRVTRGRAALVMPAPGPKDGHASKASSDLGGRRGLPREIKRVAVKSNGFKGAGGGGESTNRGLAGVRLGEGNSARSVKARQALRERFLAGLAGKKGRESKKRRREETLAAKAAAPPTEKTTVEDDTGEKEADASAQYDSAEDAPKPSAEDALAASGYYCEACKCKCGSLNNYRSHANSKRHRKAVECQRGMEILEAMKAAKRQKVEADADE